MWLWSLFIFAVLCAIVYIAIYFINKPKIRKIAEPDWSRNDLFFIEAGIARRERELRNRNIRIAGKNCSHN